VIRFLIPLLLVPMGSADPRGAAMQDVARENNRFALELYERLRANPGNMFFSPYSLSTALAMTYEGAKGETAKQMASVLHLNLPPDRRHAGFSELTQTIQRPPVANAYELVVANALWGQEGLAFKPAFLQTLKSTYGAGLRTLDFRSTEHARTVINDWVESQTRQKIKSLLAPGVLEPTTNLVLTNAIYFKGAWTKPFPKFATKDDDFHTSLTDKVRVPMMHQVGEFSYFDAGNFTALEIPYQGDALSMVILLPKSVDGLAELERSLSLEWLHKLASKRVDIQLPRFTLEKFVAMDKVLPAMGMRDAFVPKQADFSGMDGRRELYITAVIHKAFVDVNEEGTEAAAATAVVAGVRSAAKTRPVPVVPFLVDHPFVFLIHDKRSESILFLGRVTNPRG
jgi:serpin B